MAVSIKEKKFSTILLVVIIGVLIGSYLNALVSMMIPGDGNVVKTLFTYPIIDFGVGFPNPLLINLEAVKFQIGFQMKFSFLSIIGVFVSLHIFRWYH